MRELCFGDWLLGLPSLGGGTMLGRPFRGSTQSRSNSRSKAALTFGFSLISGISKFSSEEISTGFKPGERVKSMNAALPFN